MVPGAGVEPARRFSPRDFKSLVSTNFTTWASGAGNEARTRDINLGKVTLYQLSYSRLRTQTIILYKYFPSSTKLNKIMYMPIF